MNKFRSLIVSAIMVVMAMPVAFAAGKPSLNLPANESTQQSITLNNISNNVKNLQVTINLSKDQKYSFLENDTLANRAGIEVYCKEESTNSVTIYITSNVDVLTTSGSIVLGTISSNQNFNIISATGIKVTDGINPPDDLEDTGEQTPPTGDNTDNDTGNNSGDNSDNSTGDNTNNNTGSNSGGSSSGNNNNSGNNNSNNTNGSNNSNDDQTDKPENTQTLPFTDVNQSSWYYDAVRYVYDNGLMSGVSDKTFAPNANTTRGMIVTILYRLENEPSVYIDNSFKDVKASDYYGNAIYWAKQNNIVTGYSSTKFAPNDNITREQMAAILYRYAAYKGYSIDKTSDLSNFTDVSDINSYALTPIKWAVSSNIISGTGDNTISPLGNASRAQIATILMRFIENL